MLASGGGGGHHLPHSRQPSVAPEPGRKQEVGNSRGRRGAGMENRMEGLTAADEEADGPTHRQTTRTSCQAPAPSPSWRSHTRLGPKTGLGERPSRSHQRKAQSREGK